MAMIHDECGYLREEMLVTTRCANCSEFFRQDESEWASLCQRCGEDEVEQDNAALRRALGKQD